MPTMFRRVIPTILALAGALASSAAAHAQGGVFGEQDDAKVSFTTRFDPPKAKAGQEVDLVVEVMVVEGWHIYGSRQDPSGGKPTVLEVDDAFGVEMVGEPSVPAGMLHDTAGYESFWLEKSFELRQRLRVDDEEEEGELSLSGKVEFMACDHSMCLPPDSYEFEVALEIVAPEAVVEPAAPRIDAPPQNAEGATAKALAHADQILWAELLLLAVGAGLLALAMPCTYPMVPITFSFFTKQASARGGNVMPLALSYGAGIVTIFVLIGVLAAPVIVPFAQHPITNGVIGALFIVFALSLFGVIDLQPPQSLQRLAGAASSKGGYLGVFLMGLCLVVSSFTCTVPFVGTMLSLSAAGGLAKVVVGMAVFGLTMAIPFVVLALIPGRVAAMPRAGEWMNTLKVTLGFVELAAALKFISNVDLVVHDGIADAWISRELFAGIWSAIFAITALYLIGLFARGAKLGLKRRFAGLAFAGLSVYCGLGATGRELNFVMTAILPPSKHAARHELVLEDIGKAFATAKAHDKLLLINFTGLT
ncbi:MAG: hypothetical protein KDB80_17100 [Planctomycetes bacterium]|nr:hypothetical protein [Planctomycetota bacterium]